MKYRPFPCGHLLILMAVIALGCVLRFWNLEMKPLWLDEVITALFSVGRDYNDIPVATIIHSTQLQDLFVFQEGKSCSEVALTLAQQSTHPPLFFCLMYRWLDISSSWSQPLGWKLRSLSALLGVGGIIAVYFLARLAFSPTAGIMAAAFTAVSPFGVYLSQEARQYTLPVFFITLSLLASIALLKNPPLKTRLILWLMWGVCHGLACYSHYFCWLVFAAQVLLLAFLLPRKHLGILLGMSLGVVWSYSPWFPILFEHFHNPYTTWLPTPDFITPFAQLLAGFLTMAILLPVENQPIWIQAIAALTMLGFALWLERHILLGITQLYQSSVTHRATLFLGGYILVILLAYCAIIYLLQKDISIAFRYNFTYYPAVCVLLGGGFAVRNSDSRTKPIGFLKRYKSVIILFLVGVISSGCVIFNLTFPKPYLPDKVALDLNQIKKPFTVIFSYKDNLNIALGISYAMALENVRGSDTDWVFLSREKGYESLWDSISPLNIKTRDVWLMDTGLGKADFPEPLKLNDGVECKRNLNHYYRTWRSYQLYECHIPHQTVV